MGLKAEWTLSCGAKGCVSLQGVCGCECAFDDMELCWMLALVCVIVLACPCVALPAGSLEVRVNNCVQNMTFLRCEYVFAPESSLL